MSRRILTGLLVLLLAGCSSNQEAPSVYETVAIAGVARAAQTRATRVARPPLTRALLDTLEGSYLEVTLERRDQLAYLQILSERVDDTPGRITVWRTDDNITLAMRNGVLINTRGLGGDLLSSTVNVAEGVPGPAGGGARVYVLSTRDAKQQSLAMACDLTDLGATPLTIVERAHPVRHLREVCISAPETGLPGRVTNEYWVDSRSGIVWQSIQWAGPNIGYLRTRRLTN